MSEQTTKMFQAVFEHSPVGLIIVNQDTSLRDVNNYMFNTFKLIPQAIDGQKFGNLFDCAAVSGKFLTCGEAKECSECGLRGGVLAVLNNGMTISDTVMDHKFKIEGVDQNKWFKISASRIVAENKTLAIVSFVDITTQKLYEELLHNQLSLDMATGTTNKHALLNTLKNLTAGKEDLSVAMIDFDNFKAINDAHGHIVGDRVLNLFCAAAAANSRKQDIIGRFGGEEFMLVFPGASSEFLIMALQRIAKSFREACNLELNISPAFSVGIVDFSSRQMDELNIDAIIAEADINLYQSKRRGKNMITRSGKSIPFQ